MRAALHAFGTAIAIPYALLATWFVVVGEVARARGLWSVLDAVASQSLWLVTWGIYGFPLAFVCLAAAGFVPRLRRAAALVLFLVSGTSLLVLCLLPSSALEAGQMLFLTPCVAVLLGSAWLYREAGEARRLENDA